MTEMLLHGVTELTRLLSRVEVCDIVKLLAAE